uniref:ATP synthase complex subunit 8 n=1 Tax=Basiliscus vittatus TaxID=211979 RepID=C4T866_BASVI|nr:ATP synthase F0 subunit 8 [Basiliscus vittatus]BAH70386.1 ATPase subunit8 [Basiliscus vittatus]
MPQLNPAPWFLISLMTWITLMLFLNKTLYSKHLNQPAQTSLENKTTTPPWTWPWY